MASTTSDDGFHEIQLNGKQLVVLFMAVTVVSVVIFLCGVLVGRSARTDLVTTVAIPELPAAAPSAEAPPAPAAETSSAPSATANEPLSYPKRLASATPEREQLSPPSPPAVKPAPAAPPAAKATAPAPSAASTASAAPPVAKEPAGSGFAIQLAALGRREEADGIARRLTGKGYSAYVVGPDAGAPPVFRVRVGKFKDRREAESVASRLKQEEQFNPWIVR